MSERTSPRGVSDRRRGGILPGALAAVLLLMGALISIPAQPAQAAPLALGDVLVGLGSYPGSGIGRGEVRHFSPAGSLLQTLDTTSASREETGMCLDAASNLYTTNFDANSMSKFGGDGTLAAATFWAGALADGAMGHPNSCVVDAAGNLYVGLSDTYVTDPFGDYWAFGPGGLLKLDPSGSVLVTFAPAPDQRGTDWVDLAADQTTLFYTSVGSSIKRFDVGTNTQVADFCNPCHDGADGVTTVGPFFDLRILPDGSVLVADGYDWEGTGLVRRYSSAGVQTQIYVAADSWGGFYPWALALDPDGTSFWTADALTGEIFRFDLASGTVLGQFLAGECGDFFGLCEITGLAIVGEPRAALSTGTTTVTASITAADKVYDGSTAATITGCTLSPAPRRGRELQSKRRGLRQRERGQRHSGLGHGEPDRRPVEQLRPVLALGLGHRQHHPGAGLGDAEPGEQGGGHAGPAGVHRHARRLPPRRRRHRLL